MEFNLAMTSLQDDDKKGHLSSSCSTNAPVGSFAFCECSQCAVPLFLYFLFSVQFLAFQGWVPRLVIRFGVMSWWRWSCCSDGIKVLHKSFQVGHLFGQLIWFIILWEMERVSYWQGDMRSLERDRVRNKKWSVILAQLVALTHE